MSNILPVYEEGDRLTVEQLEALPDSTLFWAGPNLLPMTDSHRWNAQSVHDDSNGRLTFAMSAEDFLAFPLRFSDEGLTGAYRLFLYEDDGETLRDWLTYYPKAAEPFESATGFRILKI